MISKALVQLFVFEKDDTTFFRFLSVMLGAVHILRNHFRGGGSKPYDYVYYIS